MDETFPTRAHKYMSRNLVLQHWQGPVDSLVSYSRNRMAEYAQRVGADYVFLSGTPWDLRLSPQMQKLIALHTMWDHYDLVVCADADIIPRLGSKADIFHDETGYGRHFGIQNHLVKQLEKKHPRLADSNFAYWGGSVYRFPREIRLVLRSNYKFREAKKFSGGFNDEGALHRMAMRAGLRNEAEYYFDGQRWNHSSYEPGIESADWIHVRPRLNPSGPKVAKSVSFNLLREDGLV